MAEGYLSRFRGFAIFVMAIFALAAITSGRAQAQRERWC